MGPYEEFHLVPYGRTYLERGPLPKTVVQTSVQKVKFAGVPRLELVAGQQKASLWTTGELYRNLCR